MGLAVERIRIVLEKFKTARYTFRPLFRNPGRKAQAETHGAQKRLLSGVLAERPDDRAPNPLILHIFHLLANGDGIVVADNRGLSGVDEKRNMCLRIN